jgi:hypothetical protein
MREQYNRCNSSKNNVAVFLWWFREWSWLQIEREEVTIWPHKTNRKHRKRTPFKPTRLNSSESTSSESIYNKFKVNMITKRTRDCTSINKDKRMKKPLSQDKVEMILKRRTHCLRTKKRNPQTKIMIGQSINSFAFISNEKKTEKKDSH